MSLGDDFFADAEEEVEVTLPDIKKETKQILNSWKEQISYNTVLFVEGNQYRTDQDTFYLLQLDKPKHAKVVEQHYKKVLSTYKEYEKEINEAKEVETLNEIIIVLLEQLES